MSVSVEAAGCLLCTAAARQSCEGDEDEGDVALVTTFLRYFGNGVSFCVAFAGEGDRATFMTIARNV